MNSKQAKLSKKINNKINRKINKKLKNKFRKIRRRIRPSQGRKRFNRIPAAYSKGFKKEFSILRQTGSSMRIKGRDLIYQIPDVLTSLGDYGIMTIIPANPAYWLGTRMAAIASGYQNFRPIRFNVFYVPQCAVTQQGNVLAGTLWSMSPNSKNIQQTLKTSNGGILTQCYKPARSRISLKTNLQFNLYRMGGKFDQESNPFIFVALSIATVDSNGTKVNPGYFYVDYEYELKNPIGDTISYYTSGLIKFEDYNENYVNETVVNCSLNSVNPGAVLQKDGDQITWNDKPVTIEGGNYVWIFANQIVEPEPVELTILFNQKITVFPTTPNEGDEFVLVDPDGHALYMKDVFSQETFDFVDRDGFLVYKLTSGQDLELINTLPTIKFEQMNIKIIPDNYELHMEEQI